MNRRRHTRNLPPSVTPLPSVSTVRSAVMTLASSAVDSVRAVRNAFTAGVSPFQTVSSGSVSSYVSAFSSDPIGSRITRSTSHMGLKTSTAGSSVPPPKAELDSASVIEGPGGVLDQFSVRLTVSLPIDDADRVSSVRVMRAKLGPVKAPRPAVSALSFSPAARGRASLERSSMSAFRIDEIGVGNKLTAFIMDDPASSVRAVISPTAKELRPPLPPPNSNRGDGMSTGLLTLDGADRSVLENLSFYLNRRTIGAIEPPRGSPLRVGSVQGGNVLRGNSVSAGHGGIVQSPNSAQFVEIGRIDVGSPFARSVGEFIEAEFIDRSVAYGAAFIYYVVCVGFDGAEGARSKLIEVPVVKGNPPASPTVYYSVIGGHPRFAVRCPAGTDHVEIFRSGRPVDESVRLGTDVSLVTQGPAIKVGEFWHLSDVGVGPDGSTTFIDLDALAGDKLSYRIYSVDSYGFKSQTPFSCSVKMPEGGHNVSISVPSVTVEQAPGQPSVSVKMSIDDKRVAGFFIQRRDVSVHEKSVHQANQPEWIDIGTSTTKRAGSRRGPTLRDTDWPTYIPAQGGSGSFVDTTVKLDRKYQYAIGAIDVKGNRTLLVGSQPVTVYSKTIIDPPTAFSANVVSEHQSLKGVLLRWTGGTNDFSPNAIVDDQDVLAATSVRSVFQVERRRLGQPFWDAMPATSESYFFDRVSKDQPPAFRPAYVIPGEEYEYRVLAMQSGGFVSPRTDVLSVSVVPPPEPPEVVWVRTTPISVNPLSVIVSWNMAGDFVERWEVERAVTNKIYGEQVTTMDSRAARSLSYSRVADLTPESSRARSLSEDSSHLDRSVYVGNRFYADFDVQRMNSYFYRIRTIGRLGVASDWTYAGVFIKDSAHDRKFLSTLSDDDKVSMTLDQRPVLNFFSGFRKR